jgi:cyclophilin family peptidyl-prolyl cis-trans isomerase
MRRKSLYQWALEAFGTAQKPPRRRQNRSRKTGFEALEARQMLSISPTFSTFGTTFYNDQQAVYIPLTSGDTSQNVTYTITNNSNGAFTPTILVNNPSIDINVSGSGFTKQDITLQLFGDYTPNTVAHFVSLIQAGTYTNQEFYRVITALSGEGNFQLAQGGTGGTGSTINDEFNAAVTFNSPGIIGLARQTNNDTGSSEFFITNPSVSYAILNDTNNQLEASLNFKYTAFGQLTSGFSVFQQIMTTPVTTNGQGEDSQPVTPITINSVNVITDTQNAVLQVLNPTLTLGADTFTVTASDGTNPAQSENITVNQETSTVTDPAFLGPMPATVTTTVNNPANLTLTAVNPSNGSLTYTVTDPNNFGSTPANVQSININQATGNVTITPTPGFTGTINLLAGVSSAASPSARSQYDTQAFSLVVNAGTLSPSTLLADTVNVAYNQSITASDPAGNTTLTVSNIQNAIPGLVIPTTGATNSNTLAISGTPTAAGTETFTVTATNASGGTTIGNYSITVNPAITLNPTTLPSGNTGVAYNQTIAPGSGTGTGTVTLAVSNIQNPIPGLNVPTSGSSINITGTPTAGGKETFTVTATDSVGGTTTLNYSISVFGTVTVNGTSGNDQFVVTFTDATDFTVSLNNGAPTPYSTTLVNLVTFNGNGGSDTATVNDKFNPLNAAFTPNSLIVTSNSGSYTVVSNATTTNVATGTTSDTATMTTSTGGDDRFYGNNGALNDSLLVNTDAGTSYSDTANGFGAVAVSVPTGASTANTAYLYDGNGNNRFYGLSTQTTMANNDAGHLYSYTVNSFQHVFGIHQASSTGTDTAYLTAASTGGNTFYGLQSYSVMLGTGYYNQVNNFSAVVATSSNSTDTALLGDSTGSNVFENYNGGASPYSVFYGSGFYNRVAGFSQISATSTTGTDQAYLTDSVGDSRFYGHPTASQLVNTDSGKSYSVTASGFANVSGTANAASDTAYLYDSAGNDRFYGHETYGLLVNSDPGTTFLLLANSFAHVFASASSGSDTAYLYDSEGADTFDAYSDHSIMFGSDFYNRVDAFGTVYAFSSGGNDVANLFDSTGKATLYGYSDHSILLGSGFYNQASGFKTVNVASTTGSDTALLFDSTGNDTLTAVKASVAIQYPAAVINVADFSRVVAYSTSGGHDTQTQAKTLDYVFSLIGNWQNG